MEPIIPADSLPNPLPTLPQLPPKKSKVRKTILTIFLIIAIPPLLLYISWRILLATAKDGPPPDDRDLRLEKVEIPASENAYYDFIKIADSGKPLAEDDGYAVKYINGEVKWDDKLAKSILERNREVLDYFADAATKPSFQDPAFADPAKISINTPLMPLNVLRKAGRLEFMEATYLQKRGKEKEALDKAFILLEVGQKLQEPQNAVIHYIVGTSLKSSGLKLILNMTEEVKMANKDLLPYAEKLEKFKENETGLKAAFKGEYLVGIRIIDTSYQGFQKGGAEGLLTPLDDNFEPKSYEGTTKYILKLWKHNFYFRPNETKALAARQAKRRIDDAEKPCGLVSDRVDKEFPYSLEGKLSTAAIIRSLLTENAVGKILYDIANTSLATVFYRKCQEDFAVSSAQTLIAIKAYHNDRNSLPDSLAALVPEYLSKVPEDPFSGGELRHSKDKKIIYSVGLNMTDAGGSDVKDWNLLYQADDPTIKIAF